MLKDCFYTNVLSEQECGELSAPVNGSIEYTDTTRKADTEATYSCDVGFKLHGNNKRFCLLKITKYDWTGTQPSCEGK